MRHAAHEGRRSLIAGANAWFRAKESTRRDRILSDPWAETLAERDPRIQAIRFGRFALPPLGRAIDELQAAHCVRHRAIDRLTLQAVAGGARQVVVVGAGYDMRASRFAAELDGVRWIEVDQAAMIARKQTRLAGRRDTRPVERVAADLEREGLAEALRRTSFDATVSTVFVAEGFLHYLSRARLDALLADAARLRAPATLVFSFIDTAMYDRATSTFVRLVKTVQEIPRLHFTPGEIAAVCASAGFGAFRSWTYDAQVAEFAPMARGRTAPLAQDVAAVERRGERA